MRDNSYLCPGVLSYSRDFFAQIRTRGFEHRDCITKFMQAVRNTASNMPCIASHGMFETISTFFGRYGGMLWQGPLDTWNIWSVCTILQITKRYLGTFHALPFLDWLENIGRFYPPEYLASLVWDTFISLITLLAYTAIAGAVGAGRLSDIAIRYGYHRDQFDV